MGFCLLHEPRPHDGGIGPNLTQFAVRAVAEGLGGGMFAGAPGDGFGFGDFDLLRHEAGATVGAVAKGLALGPAAGAPEVGAGRNFLDDRAFLEDDGVAHKCFVFVEQRSGRRGMVASKMVSVLLCGEL